MSNRVLKPRLRILPAFLFAAMAVAPAAAQQPSEKELEEAWLSSLHLFREIAETLQAIKDVESFKKAEPRFDELETKAKQIVAKGKQLGPAPKELHAQWFTKHFESFRAAGEPMQLAMLRIGQDEKLLKLVKGRVDSILKTLQSNPGPSPFQGIQEPPKPEGPKLQVVPGDANANLLAGEVQAHEDDVCAVAFSRDGSRCATAGALDRTVKLWNTKTGALLATLRGLPDPNQIGSFEFLQFTVDGEALYAGSTLGEVYRWTLKSNVVERVAQFDPAFFHGSGYAIGGDGRHLLGGDQTWVAVIDLQDETIVKLRNVSPSAVWLSHGEFLRDDKYLMAVYTHQFPSQTIEVWQWREGKPVWKKEFDHALKAAAISSDGKQVIAVVEHTLPPNETDFVPAPKQVAKINYYNLAGGEPQRSVVLEENGEYWTFSQDRNWLLSVLPRRLGAVVYRVDTGERVAAFPAKEFTGYARVGDLSSASNLLVIGDSAGKLYSHRLELPSEVSKGMEPANEFRAWTSADGRFTIKAKLLKVADGRVELERSDGKVIVVPLASLSAEDNEYVKPRK